MDITNSFNSNSNETLEDGINLLLENRKLTLQSEIETNVVDISFNANQLLEDNIVCVTLDEHHTQKEANDKPATACTLQILLAQLHCYFSESLTYSFSQLCASLLFSWKIIFCSSMSCYHCWSCVHLIITAINDCKDSVADAS